MTALPRGWLVDDAESVRREAEPYVSMTPAGRAAHLVAACRGMARLLRSRPDRERVLAHRDPLPTSSVAALAHLRRQAADRRTRSG